MLVFVLFTVSVTLKNQSKTMLPYIRNIQVTSQVQFFFIEQVLLIEQRQLHFNNCLSCDFNVDYLHRRSVVLIQKATRRIYMLLKL